MNTYKETYEKALLSAGLKNIHTISISDNIWHAFKLLAAEQGTSISAEIQKYMKERIAERVKKEQAEINLPPSLDHPSIKEFIERLKK